MKALQIPQSIRLLVAQRDGPWCARCSQSIVNVPSAVHHRWARGMGGSSDPRVNDLRNLVQVCRRCHEWVHAHPKRAREAGWIVSSLDGLDTRMRTLLGSWIQLFEDGSMDAGWPWEDVTDGA